MDDIALMQGHLARLQHDINRLRLIDLCRNAFTAPEQIVIVSDIGMIEHALLMGSGDHAHATVRRMTGGERDPG